MGLNKSRSWRWSYAFCCIAYVAWVLYLSLNNFDMVHNRYRQAGERLQPEQLEEITRQEIIDQCRKESKRTPDRRPATKVTTVPEEDPCLSWPSAVLAERQKKVEERLLTEQSKAARKLALFYVSFVVIFLIVPLVILYLLLSMLTWMYKTMRLIK